MSHYHRPVPEDPAGEAAALRAEFRESKRQAKAAGEPFVILPKAISHFLHDQVLPPGAVRLLLFTMMNANTSGELKQSMTQTALALGVSLATISRTFAKLEDVGLVKLVQFKEGGSYHVFLRPVPQKLSKEAGER